jgi:hypothetical protein
VYYETERLLRKINTQINSRWPAGIAKDYYLDLTPGFLLSKRHVIVQVPYLTREELTEFWCRPSDVPSPLVLPEICYLQVRIVPEHGADDSEWDSYTVDEKNSHLHRLMFAYRRAMVGPQGECACSMLLHFLDGSKWTSEYYVSEHDGPEYDFAARYT